MSNRQRVFLEKATFTTSDLSGGTNGGLLSAQQTKEFLRVAQNASVILSEARHETSDSKVFEVPRISFGSRIMKAGTEGSRLADADRVEPTTGLLQLSTVLLKGEVLVSEEALEDNIEKDGMADTFMEEIAKAVGRDVEELVIQGDTARDTAGGEDSYLDLLDGLIAQLQDNLSSTKEIDADASGAPETYEGLFAKMLEALEDKYKSDPSSLRLYLPSTHAEKYATAIAQRGTALGDAVQLQGAKAVPSFRGIPIRSVPLLSGTDTINSSAIDYSKFAFITHPKNIIVGWHRKIVVRKYFDPQAGAWSFLPSCRVAVGFGDPDAAVYAYDIPTTLI